jgi:hypothetical protein
MQLPRGTFREIKKNVKFGGLFEELQQTRFSGICTISFGKTNGIIVFKSGKRILAEYENCIGDAAWDELQKIVEENVDVALSTLVVAQIQLSLEFNKSYRILNIAKGEQPLPQTISSTQPQTIKKSLLPSQKQGEEAVVNNNLISGVSEGNASIRSMMGESHPTKALSKNTIHTLSTNTVHKHSALSPQSKNYAQSPDKKEIVKDNASPISEMNSRDIKKDIDTFETMDLDAMSNFDRDIDNFETMDLEAITNKIRGECKDIIKQLNLEYLKEH